jgi:hypothetical protein
VTARCTRALAFGALCGLLCGAGQAAAGDHRVVPDRELPLHQPTGITFPAQAGPLPRKWVHEQANNPKIVRVGYGDAAWIEVAPSGEAASAKLASLKRSLQLRNAAAVVTQPAAVGRGMFRGWKTAMRGTPRGDFVAARKCGKYMLSVRAWSLDAKNQEPLKRLGQAVSQIFADPGAAPGAGFACE